MPILALFLLHKIYWLNYNWTGIFTIKPLKKIKKKKSKIFKNQKKRNQKFKKKPQKNILIDFIAHLITYVRIEITLMFLYSLVTRNIISLIVNFELCAVIYFCTIHLITLILFYVSVSSIPNHSYKMYPYPQQLDIGLFHFFFLP